MPSRDGNVLTAGICGPPERPKPPPGAVNESPCGTVLKRAIVAAEQRLREYAPLRHWIAKNSNGEHGQIEPGMDLPVPMAHTLMSKPAVPPSTTPTAFLGRALAYAGAGTVLTVAMVAGAQLLAQQWQGARLLTPQVALAYLIVSGFLFALSRQPATIAMPAKGVPNAVPAE